MEDDYETEPEAMDVEDPSPTVFVYGKRSAASSSKGRHPGNFSEDSLAFQGPSGSGSVVGTSAQSAHAAEEKLLDFGFDNDFGDDFDDSNYI